MQQQLKIIISGGGTGGHIFPAVAIANQIKKEHNNANILFVGALGRMEMTKVPQAGYKIIGLPITGIQRKLVFSNLLFPFKLLKSIWKAFRILSDFKPDVVIGVGGYASAAIVFAATKKKIPTLIQEQNSYAGLTNKWLGKKVDRICAAFDGMDKYFPASKIIVTGNPVRNEIIETFSSPRKLSDFPNNLLVIGGSLGARTINLAIEKGIRELTANNIKVRWQTGNSFEPIAKSLESESVTVSAFIEDMPTAYNEADIVVSRAGALSVSELSIVGKPCILVPSPNVAEDHQTKNATILTTNHAAILVKDEDAFQTLIPEIIRLFRSKEEQEKLATQIRKHAHPDATKKIVEEIYSLLA